MGSNNKPRTPRRRWVSGVLAGAGLFFASVATAATITVVNLDGANEGFNDPAPFTPVGGNNATRLGQARLIAFQYAADLAAGQIRSNVTIRVGANMDPLGGDAGSAVLGAAGPTTVHRDFTGAPVASTWYVQALANKLNGADLAPTYNDISAEFNSDVDNGTVLGASNWYYGLDGNAGSHVDFVSVVLHELVHGLGFLALIDSSGAKFLGWNDAYMRHLEHHGAVTSDYPTMTDAQRVTASTSLTNLHWTGAAVRAGSGVLSAGVTGDHVYMYAPSPYEDGSSVSHFNTSLFPNQLMEPYYTTPIHDLSLAGALLNDIGWGSVGDLAADLAVTLTDSSDPATVGNNLTYTITVTNNGPDDSTGIVVTDTLPAGVDYVSTTPSQGACSGTTTVTCLLGTLANSASATVSLVVRPATTSAGITNSVNVTSLVSDSAPGSNSASETTVVNNPLPTISSLTPSYALVGGSGYTLTVNGTNFVNGASAVLWNGTARATTFVSDTRLTASISAADIAAAGSATVTVENNAPGGGASNAVVLTITNAVSVGSGGGGGGGCFIATAAYGSPMMSEVRYLRALRDQYLLTHAPGRVFVEVYYKLSPPLADFIRHQDGARAIIRGLLAPLVALSKRLVSEESVGTQTTDRP